MSILHLILAFFLYLQGPTLPMGGIGPGASAPVTITRVDPWQTANGACSTSLTVTFPTSTTAGELIVATYLTAVTTATGTITDNKGGGSSTYTKDGEITGMGSHGTFGFQHTANSASGITVITLASTSQSECALLAAHYKNLATSPLDQNTGNPSSSSGSGSLTFASTPTKTTAFANELLLGPVGCYATGSNTCAVSSSGIWPASVAAQKVVNGGLAAVGIQELIVSSVQTSIANTGTVAGTSDTLYAAPMLVTFHQ